MMTFFQALNLTLMMFVVMTSVFIGIFLKRTEGCQDFTYRFYGLFFIVAIMILPFTILGGAINNIHTTHPEYFRFPDKQFIDDEAINIQNEYQFFTHNIDITEVNPDNKSIVSEGILDLSQNVLFKTHIVKQKKDKMLIDFDLIQSDGHHKHKLGIMSKKEYMGHIEPLTDLYSDTSDALHGESNVEEFRKHTAHSLTELKSIFDH